MEIIKLLENKNRCLKKLLNLTENFLSEVQEGNFSKLTHFQQERAKFFKVFQLYDRKLSLAKQIFHAQISSNEKNENEIRLTLQAMSKEQETIISFILDRDKTIIKRLEDEKNKVYETLFQSDEHRQMIQKFKSSWITESGIKLDGVV